MAFRALEETKNDVILKKTGFVPLFNLYSHAVPHFHVIHGHKICRIASSSIFLKKLLTNIWNVLIKRLRTIRQLNSNENIKENI